MTTFAGIHATVPIRICDNGGWTDTWVARHGKVFNIAVRPLVIVRVDVWQRGTRERPVVINVENYGLRYAPPPGGASWGPHPLVEAALQAVPPPEQVDVEVTIRSDAPTGASTGTSAAVLVALLGALDRLADGGRTAHEIAFEAHAVETVRLGRQSGVQDQLCSALGGINYTEIFDYPHAVVTRLDLGADWLRALEQRLALIYLGRPHSSSAVHETVMRDLAERGPDYGPLQALRRAAENARDAALAGDFDALGRAMRDNTNAQSALEPALIGADAWRVIEIASASGAVGWKVNGAGGEGGSITLLCEGDVATQAIVREVEHALPGLRSIPIALSADGLRVWTE